MAGGVLVVARAAAGDVPQDFRTDETGLGAGGLEADVGDVHLAGVEPPRRDGEPELAAVEGDGGVGDDRGSGGFARRRTDAGGHVNREHRRGGRVDPFDQRRGIRPRRAGEAGAEQRVDDHVRIAQVGLTSLRVDDQHVAPGTLQLARGDPAVAAVGAAAAHGRPPAGGGKAVEREPCRLAPGTLHQLFGRAGEARLGGLHLLGRVQRLEFRHQS